MIMLGSDDARTRQKRRLAYRLSELIMIGVSEKSRVLGLPLYTPCRGVTLFEFGFAVYYTALTCLPVKEHHLMRIQDAF